MDELVKQLEEFLNFEIEPLVFAKKVEKCNSEAGRVICATEFAFYTFAPKRIGKGYRQVGCYPWNTLKEFAAPDFNSISFTFDSKLTEPKVLIEDNYSLHLVRRIIKHFQSIFTTDEFPNIDLDAVYYQDYVPSKFPVEKRLRFLAYVAKITIPNDLFEAIHEFSLIHAKRVQLHKNSIPIDCTKLPHFEEYSNLIFKAFLIDSTLTELIIGKNDNPKWQEVSEYIIKQNKIARLITEEAPTNDLLTFSTSISKSNNSHLSSISFLNNTFDSTFISYIIPLFSAKNPITSLSMSNGLNEDGYKAFISSVHDTNFSKTLRQLDVSSSLSINLSELIKALPALQVLSVSKCQISVHDAFTQLSELSICSLTSIDLSYNNSELPINDIVLPQSITSINVSNVTWNKKSFTSFIKCISKHRIQRLDISNANGHFDLSFHHVKFPDLVSFSSNNNPPSDSLIRLLENCPRLQELSLNGVFKSSDAALFDSFSKYVSQSSLTKLCVAGDETHFLGAISSSLMRAIRDNKTLQQLDISSNLIGITILTEIIQAISVNNTLSDIEIDNNMLNDLDQLLVFARAIEASGRKIHVGFPKTDIMSNRKESIVTEIVETLRRASNGAENCQQKKKRVVRNASNSTAPDDIATIGVSKAKEDATTRGYISDDYWQTTLAWIPGCSQYDVLNDMAQTFAVRNLIDFIDKQNNMS